MASSTTTKKLTGPAMERLVERLAESEGLSEPDAQRLARRFARMVSSLQARRAELADLERKPRRPKPPARPAAPPPVPASTSTTSPSAPMPSMPSQAFDPFAFGLVPVFQREGRDGLLARLATVTSAEHLRQMARAQQIVLEAALRSGDVEPAALRAAIVTAVEKRIADRRAAAG
jgi:hypothetical protein